MMELLHQVTSLLWDFFKARILFTECHFVSSNPKQGNDIGKHLNAVGVMLG